MTTHYCNKIYYGHTSVCDINSAICDINNNIHLNPGISFLIRAKNEEDNVFDCLMSIIDIDCEIIFVDNGSTDNTLSIARNLEKKYENLYVYEYNINIPRVGLEHTKAVNSKSENTLGTYYNWCLSKVTKYNVIKWDCDFISIKNNLLRMLESYNLYNRSDKFALWFTGKTLFYDHFVRVKDIYNEFRVFSKLNGFEWTDYKQYETSHFYVCRPSCLKYICSLYFVDTVNSYFIEKKDKAIVKLQNESYPIFFERKNEDDIKKLDNCVDQRDKDDNNILIKYKNNSNYSVNELSDPNNKIMIIVDTSSTFVISWITTIYLNLINLGYHVKIMTSIRNKIKCKWIFNKDILYVKKNEWIPYIFKNKYNTVFLTNILIGNCKLKKMNDVGINLYFSKYKLQEDTDKYLNKNYNFFTKILSYYHSTIYNQSIFISNSILNINNKDTIGIYGDMYTIIVLYAIKKLINNKKWGKYKLKIFCNNLNLFQKYISDMKMENYVQFCKYPEYCNFYIFLSISHNIESYTNIIKLGINGIPILGSQNGLYEHIMEDYGLFFWLRRNNKDINNKDINNPLESIGYINNNDVMISPHLKEQKTEYTANQCIMFNKNVNVIANNMLTMIKNKDIYIKKAIELKKIFQERYSSKKYFNNSLLRTIGNANIEFI